MLLHPRADSGRSLAGSLAGSLVLDCLRRSVRATIHMYNIMSYNEKVRKFPARPPDEHSRREEAAHVGDQKGQGADANT